MSSATEWAQWAEITADFVAFATSHLDPDDAAGVSSNLEAAFMDLHPDERKQVMSKIEEIVTAEEGLMGFAEQVNAVQDAESALPVWAEIRSASLELANLFEELVKLWNSTPKEDSTFGYLLNQRGAQARELERDANMLNNSDPISAAGGASAFEAGMASLNLKSEQQPRVYGSNIHWLRWQKLEEARSSRSKAPGMKLVPLQKPDSTWRPIQSMEGGMGKIQVWAKDDGQGRIMDRIVLKDTTMLEESWTAPLHWYGPGVDNVPIEFWVHSQMSGRGENIVELKSREAQINDQTRTFRMWMEYCPNGDLFGLIRRHRDANHAVPVEFILYAFKALADACLLMEQGAVSEKLDGWEQIVHRDLKPENVFLGLSQASFNNYPQPKLADFGLAIVTDADDPTNPDLYNIGCGTQGYLAPEQVRIEDQRTGEPIDNFKLLAPCNVWGIGVIILDLLECTSRNYKKQPDYRRKDEHEREYCVTMALRQTYYAEKSIWGAEPYVHNDVFDMVDRCLKYQPEERPTAAELRTWLEKKMIPMTTWLEQIGEAGDPDQAVLPKEQLHYVGMAFADLARVDSSGFSLPPSSSVGGGAPLGGGTGGGAGGGLRIVNAAPGDFSAPEALLSSGAAEFLAGSDDE